MEEETAWLLRIVGLVSSSQPEAARTALAAWTEDHPDAAANWYILARLMQSGAGNLAEQIARRLTDEGEGRRVAAFRQALEVLAVDEGASGSPGLDPGLVLHRLESYLARLRVRAAGLVPERDVVRPWEASRQDAGRLAIQYLEDYLERIQRFGGATARGACVVARLEAWLARIRAASYRSEAVVLGDLARWQARVVARRTQVEQRRRQDRVLRDLEEWLVRIQWRSEWLLVAASLVPAFGAGERGGVMFGKGVA